MNLTDLNDPNVQGPALVVLALAFVALMMLGEIVFSAIAAISEWRWKRQLEKDRR